VRWDTWDWRNKEQVGWVTDEFAHLVQTGGHAPFQIHEGTTKVDRACSAQAGCSDVLELLEARASDHPKAACHRYRLPATSGHPIGQEFGTSMTGPKVQRPLDGAAPVLNVCDPAPTAGGELTVQQRAAQAYCPGVCPVVRLKCRVKWLWSEKPALMATSLNEVPRKINALAFSTLTPRR